MKEKVEITCVYFKESGKYYSTGVDLFDADDFKDCVYPREYGHKLLIQGKLPGLVSGIWNYCFAVMVDNHYEELVIQ